MATVVAGARLMAGDNAHPKILTAATRLAALLLPPHRKDWAQAIFNEMAYIESRPAALRWALGAVLFAIKERASYELLSLLRPREPHKALVALSLATALTVTGMYAVQKPYQRERILLLVLHGCTKSGCPR